MFTLQFAGRLLGCFFSRKLRGLPSCSSRIAFSDEWTWKVAGFSRPTFPTKAEAIDLHARPDGRRSALCVADDQQSNALREPQRSPLRSTCTRRPPIASAQPAPWRYCDATWGARTQRGTSINE